MHGTSAGSPVSLTGYGGLVTLAKPTAVPEGASPRTYDTDFQVGSVGTRAGLTSIYNPSPASVGPNAPNTAVSTTWANPTNILLNDGSFTSFSPVVNSNAIDLGEFVFSIPPSSSPTGFLLTVYGYSNVPCTLIAQILVPGTPVPVAMGSVRGGPMPQTLGTIPIGSLTDLWDFFPTVDQINGVTFGVRLMAFTSGFDSATAFVDYATLTVGLNTGTSNFNFVTTFTAQNGDVKNLSLDANGNFYVEDVTNAPGALTLAIENITPNSYAVGVNGPDVEYLAFSNGLSGSDMPLQWTPDWVDRITQVGPGAAPSFTPASSPANTYPITSITQFPANSDITDPGNFSVLLQSAGPGSTSPGNVITVYYSPGFFGGAPHPEAEDMTLVNAFDSGVPVYVYITGAVFGNGTWLVTSVGNALPPSVDHFRYYFTFTVPTAAYQLIVETPGTYQMTVGTMTMGAPVPGLTVGNKVTITGASVTNWDNTWPISNAINSASMVITNTSVAASVATYNYSVVTGAPPLAGELVTVTGTTNANLALNVTNATIVAVSGGASGTFTVAVSVVSAPSVSESGQATTAGTVFQFDPGLLTLGTLSNPIYGNSTGGTLTFTSATAQLIAPGTRQGTVFFITRNGYETAPAPPVTFTCPQNTTGIVATNIPIGPPNVIARGIALTEAGANGVPGANFFTIPTPVTYIVNNLSFTATALIINDNTSTSATFVFTDDVLLNAEAIDVYGFNLFNQIEIGDPAWITSYDGRNFYGLCRNKVQNFLNLSFDGGYLPSMQSGQLAPLGWTNPDIYGQLVVSPKFGNAYYIKNTSANTLQVGGLITQDAYLDAFKIPIIDTNTKYSVRVSARIPSNLHSGNLVVSLTSGGVTNGSFTIPFASMSTSYKIFSGTLLTTVFPTVPNNLILELFTTNLGPTNDVEIDRIEIFPTAIPILTTTVYASYAGLPEQVDAVTGQVKFESENQQPVNGAVVMYDTFYALKGWAGTAPGASLYSLQATANLEPSDWAEPEVAQKSGAIGVLAYDFGEQWIVMANRNGLYLFEGGQPGKINHEIIDVWNLINWTAAKTIWVRNDVVNRRLFIGVPMSTPNFYLPYAPVVRNPTSPNVILMLNYQGMDSGDQIKSEPQMHTTMFGTLTAIDMRRKWSIWQIPSPYAAICQFKNSFTHETDQEIYICNGRGNSKIYQLDPTAQTDDGILIDSVYTTAGLVPAAKRAEVQGIGNFRLRWDYMVVDLNTLGTTNVTFYPNDLINPNDFLGSNPPGYNSWLLPGGLSPGSPAFNDTECPLNFAATRTFIEFRENDGFSWNMSDLVLHVKKDVWNALRGSKS